MCLGRMRAVVGFSFMSILLARGHVFLEAWMGLAEQRSFTCGADRVIAGHT